jgi:hypothetical protein
MISEDMGIYTWRGIYRRLEDGLARVKSWSQG